MFNLFTLSFIGAVIFAMSSLTVHLLRSDLKTTKDVLSKYAVGSSGWLLTIGLYSMGFSQILMSFALMNVYGISLGFQTLGLAGIGIVLVAVFKIEFSKKKSIRGLLHNLGAGIQFLFFPISLLLLAETFENSTLLAFSNTIGSTTLLLCLIIAYIYFGRLTDNLEYFGGIQKLNVLLITIWMVLTSATLM